MNKIVEDRVTEYIRSLMPPHDEFLQNLREESKKNGIPIVEPEVAQFLLFLVKVRRCKRILEIGTAVGYSAILMGKAIEANDGEIITIERNKERYLQAKKNISQAGLHHIIKPVYGDAADILPQMDEEYDFIFLDAAKGQYLIFFPELYRILTQGGILVADNVFYKGLVLPGSKFHRRKKTMVRRLRKFLTELSSDSALVTTILPLGDGLAVTYKEGDFKDE